MKAKLNLPPEGNTKSPVSKTDEGETVVDMAAVTQKEGPGRKLPKKRQKETAKAPAEKATETKQARGPKRRKPKAPKESSPSGKPAAAKAGPKPRQAAAGDPFSKPDATSKRLKLFVWGDTGSGKTLTALQFPAPAVVDLEGSTELYAGVTLRGTGAVVDFRRLDANDFDEIEGAINWLLTNDHGHRTLVIDPISVLWEALQDKWGAIFLKHRPSGRQGHKHAFYDLQPGDWRHIKGELKRLIRKIHRLDMNVVATAREKPEYAEGELMRKIGVTFDGEKNLGYYFDTVVRLEPAEDGMHAANVIKDRTGHLTAETYEYKGADGFYPILEKAWGAAEFEREAVAMEPISIGKRLQISGLIETLGFKDDAVEAALAKYGAQRVEELSQEDARTVLAGLRERVESLDKE